MPFLRSVLLAILTLGVIATTLATPALAQATTLIILRHADRDGLTVDELNATGVARAEALVGALEGVHIDAIYTIDRVRNRDTAIPLAAARELEPIIVETNAMTDSLLTGNKGKTVVWIGNTGNIADLWEALGASGRAPTRYGDLYFVTYGDGRTRVDRRHFGP